MPALNYKHLRYFWVVAKAGGIARAAEQLHLTPQSVSGQLTTLEATLGVQLLRRSGRKVELTEVGRRALRYADEIFGIGDELLEMLRGAPSAPALTFKVGIADVVPKTVAFRLVEPALRMPDAVRLVCREGPLDAMLAELAVHRLDLVIADRPMPPTTSVRGFNHFLGDSAIAVFAAPQLAAGLSGGFPRCLDDAPLLLPGPDVAIRPRLMHWFDEQRVRPRVVAEFDDGALMKAFGRAGAGVFVAPAATADPVCRQYGVQVIGTIDAVREQLYAITTQRRLTHPAVVAISQVAREELFVSGE